MFIECRRTCKEYRDYKFLIDNIENEITKRRADESLKYYLSEAVKYKCRSIVFSFAAIILPIIATFASSSAITVPDYLIPIITALTALFTGIQALFKYNDKKVTYRNYAEELKCELYCFHSKINAYNNLSNKEREKVLADRINRLIKESNAKISSLESDNKFNDEGTTKTAEPSSNDEGTTKTTEQSSNDEETTKTAEPSSNDEETTRTTEPSSNDEGTTKTTDTSLNHEKKHKINAVLKNQNQGAKSSKVLSNSSKKKKLQRKRRRLRRRSQASTNQTEKTNKIENASANEETDNGNIDTQ